MNINIGTVINGFKVTRIRPSEELGGRLIEMKHTGCGADLLFMENGNSNMLFCVGFKTLPEDSTGVFHILEHSVLCGSEKYPVKEPFVDLLKSSMNTFLNAMTFQDKTIYPVSSRNERDFLNLTGVYLDAVFAPRCVQDPNAFRQEGWHLEVNENGEPFFNGVVYNEMKGAMSGVDDIIFEGMGHLLYPDNCYGFNSGGAPEHIPQLTYEQYKAMYRKYYHPSNARFFLDGNVPLAETLALIDSYLSEAGFEDASHKVEFQVPRTARKTMYYEIGAEETEKNRTQICFGRLFGSFAEKRKLMMCDILCSLLADTNDNPIPAAVLEKELGEEVELYLVDGEAQGRVILCVRNTEADREEEIRNTCEDVIKKLIADGLDKQMLTAYVNKYAFRIKDMREPAGLIRCIFSYNSSLYGGDPLMYLENDADIAYLREAIDTDAYEKLLAEVFDFNAMSVLTVLPSKTHGEKLRAEEAARAKKMFDSMTDEQKSQLEAANERLHAWQQQPDSPEETAKLPVLPLSEVSPEPLVTPTEISEINGVKVMYHAVPSNGITHLKLYFGISDLDVEELSEAGLIAMLLTQLPTKKHSVPELQKLINTYIGSLKFSVTSSSTGQRRCMPYLAVSIDVLDENIEKALEIAAEILLETDLSDAKRIKTNLLQIEVQTKQMAIMGGNSVGMLAVNSQYFASGVAGDAVNGIVFRRFIKKITEQIETNADGICADLAGLLVRMVDASRLVIGATADRMPSLGKFIDSFAKSGIVLEETDYAPQLPAKLGIRIPAQVSFAEKGIAVTNFSGSMKVAANIISLCHLWNKVRVQGGAYGSGLSVNSRGFMCHYSYRDPSPARSLGVYDADSEFIKEFCGSDESLEKFIISAIARTEPLLSPAQAGSIADMDILNGNTAAKQKKERGEMLHTTREDLLAIAKTLDDCAENGAVCVIGSESALSQIEGLTVFDV